MPPIAVRIQFFCSTYFQIFAAELTHCLSHLQGLTPVDARGCAVPGRVDFLTGETLWEEGVGIASLIIVDGKLIVLNERGTLFIAEATPKGYHGLATARVHVRGEDLREAKGKCWTAPIFCRGRLFCRNDRGEIVCIDMRD